MREKRITIRKLVTDWNHPKLVCQKGGTFLIDLLPDLYNKEKTDTMIYGGSQKEYELLSTDARNKFINGNVRMYKNKRYFAVAGLANDLRRWLFSEEVIVYSKESLHVGVRTAKESMIYNIQNYVASTRPALHKEHPVFQNIVLDETTVYDMRLVKAIQELLEKNTEKSCSYAMFLLMLVAIFQEEIVTFEKFYEETAIAKVLDKILVPDSTMMMPSSDIVDGVHYVYFTDKAYMHEYDVYMQKPVYGRLIHSVKLKMELDDNQIPKATLILKDEIKDVISKTPVLIKQFVGIPVLCVKDEIVSIQFKSPEGLFAFLCFRYDTFHFRGMYYRTALFISSYPKNRVPLVQKVAITLKEKNDGDLPVLKGILKLNDGKIVLAPKKLKEFLQEFEQEPWMPEFREDFGSFLENHKRPYYVFSEEEIMAYTLSDIDELDRIRIMEILKSKSESSEFVDCQDPLRLHRMFQ